MFWPARYLSPSPNDFSTPAREGSRGAREGSSPAGEVSIRAKFSYNRPKDEVPGGKEVNARRGVVKLFGRSHAKDATSEQRERLAELADERKTLLEALRIDASRFAAKVLSGEPIEDNHANGPQIQAFCGTLEYVASFLSSGGPIDYVNGEGEAMIHFAAEGWQPDVLRVLLSSGASPDLQDNLGRTALHRWVEGPSPKVCESFPTWTVEVLEGRQSEAINVLRDHECSLELPDSRGAAPLHSAVHTGKIVAARILLVAGADVLQLTDRGATPILLAFLNDDHQVARLLLEWGADPCDPLHTASGTLADLVENEGSEEMKSVFSDYIA